MFPENIADQPDLFLTTFCLPTASSLLMSSEYIWPHIQSFEVLEL